MLNKVIELTANYVHNSGNKRLAEKIRNNGKTIEDSLLSTVSAVKRQHLNGRKLSEATGFKHSVDLETGLMMTIDFYHRFFTNKSTQRAR